MGAGKHKSVHLEHASALAQVCKTRGQMKALVCAEDVEAMLRAAYEDGVLAGRDIQEAESDD